ncbi:hypothetical protein SLA2020_247220 [Shorea laevis]
MEGGKFNRQQWSGSGRNMVNESAAKQSMILDLPTSYPLGNYLDKESEINPHPRNVCDGVTLASFFVCMYVIKAPTPGNALLGSACLLPFRTHFS